MPVPTEEIWRSTADDFQKIWNFPNCLGSIDGKHVAIQAPANSGAQFYNYKGTFSIVLMALVDARYRFTVIDVGAYGRNSDGGIFSESVLGLSLENKTLQVPPEACLPGTQTPMPFVIIGDEAFPLKTYLMRPYPGRQTTEEQQVFNYRLSRARRVVENAFGILAQRWRIYLRKIPLLPENAEKVVKATCILHNFLQVTGEVVEPIGAGQHVGIFDNPEAIHGIVRLAGSRASTEAYNVRDRLKNYFTSPIGSVAWQTTMVRRGLN